MARVIVDLSDIPLLLKDKNTKYFWYKIVDENQQGSDESVNYKIKIADNSTTASYLTNTDSGIFGKA